VYAWVDTLSVFNNTYFIHKWMYVYWDASTHAKIYESGEK